MDQTPYQKLELDLIKEIREEFKKRPYIYWQKGSLYEYGLGRTFRIRSIDPVKIVADVFCFGDPVLTVTVHYPLSSVGKITVSENVKKEEQVKTSKAVRSSDADDVAFHLISPIALARLAATYREGSNKYGDFNWTKGFPPGECLNHALRHISYYLLGDRSEDHLSHAAWNLFAVMHFEHTNPELTLHKYSEQAKEILDSIKAPIVKAHTPEVTPHVK